MFRSSFLWRLYAGFVGVILICALTINLLLSDYIKENNIAALNEDLLARAYFLKEVALPYLNESNPNIHELQKHLLQLDSHIYSRLTVIDAKGKVLADSRKDSESMDNHLLRPEIQAALVSVQGESQRFSDTIKLNMKYLALSLRDDKKLVGFVRVALPVREIMEQQKQLTTYIIAGCVFATFIALIFGFFLARRFSLPVIALTKSAEAMAQGDYQQRVYINNKDELGKLAHAFNFMAASAHDRMERITEDRNKLSTILSGLVEGVIALDNHQNIIHINDAAARTLKISVSASMGASVWSTIHIVEIHELLQKIFTQGGVSQTQVRIPGEKNDTVIEVYGASLDQSSLDGRNKQGAILVLHDISELEMLENIRRDFVTNASHELKTPLTALRGVIETILNDPDMEQETLWHFLNRMQGQTERLVNIVSDLMALSRLESGKQSDFQPVSLKAILNQSIKVFSAIANEKKIQISHNLDNIVNEQARISGDAHSLGQLVDNLIDNALKYTPAKGKVNIELNINNDEQQIELRIRDNGVGISKANQARIFERFYRVDKGRSRELGGTGLGLAISKHIVEQHQGSISLDSEPGKGSTFIVRFPML